jgi:uncharacterized membrane protein
LKQDNHGYWKANLRILGALLSIWFIVSFGFGILLVEELNQIPFFGFKLGILVGPTRGHLRIRGLNLRLHPFDAKAG